MDITKLGITELKALVYDTLKMIEMCQRDLNVINGRIKTLEEADNGNRKADLEPSEGEQENKGGMQTPDDTQQGATK